MIAVHTFRPGKGYARFETVAAVHDSLADPACVFFVDLETPTPDEEKVLREVLPFHPLTVEDVLEDHSLPKVEDFDDYLYVVVHGIEPGEKATDFELKELDLLLGDRFLVAHRRRPFRSVAAVVEEFPRRCDHVLKNPVETFHAILDRLVDHFLPLMDRLDAEIEELEDDVLNRPGPVVLRRIIEFKRSLQRLRRAAVHQREILFRLSRGEFPRISGDRVAYFRDVHDHFLRVTDLAEGYRELVTSVLDAYLSTTSNRMNEIMKFLTLISTVMLPLTFIAGVYGMNFDLMPELRWKLGYAFALGLMAATAVGLVWYFRRKRWM